MFVVIVTCVALIEVLSFIVVTQMLVPRGYVYDPGRLRPLSSTEYKKAVVRVNNPSLASAKISTADGSRRSPGFDSNEPACVSLYGDSFTWADDVQDDQAWGHLLAQRLSCRVANYGLPGAGIDQALLRYENNTADKAEINVLAFFSEDIVRHVTRNIGWIYPQFPNALPVTKPRFSIDDDDSLILIPIKNPDYDIYPKYILNPGSYVSKDFLIPGGPSGLATSRFPYTRRMLETFLNYKIVAKIKGKPWYGDFYEATHPSQALQISAKIVQRFVDLSSQRNSLSLVVFLPSILDFIYYRKYDRWVYKPLVSEIEQQSIKVVNVAELFLNKKAVHDICDLYATQSGQGECGGHYSVEGNQLLADIMESLVSTLPSPSH